MKLLDISQNLVITKSYDVFLYYNKMKVGTYYKTIR